MIRELGATLEALKPYLRKYLLAKGTIFKGRLFSCPHKELHKNLDLKPACNFLNPEETQYFCYVCLPGTEMIRTPQGVKAIKDAQVGDYTYSVGGTTTKIISKVKHLPIYPIVKIGTALFPVGHKMTANHAVPVVPKEQVYTRPYVGNKGLFGLKFYGRALFRKHIKKYQTGLFFNKIPARDIAIGDYLLYPSTRGELCLEALDVSKFTRKYVKGPRNSRITSIKLTEDTLWLFGLYVAEGNTYRGGIRFTLHKNEKALQERIKSILHNSFGKDLRGEQVRGNSWTATCSSTDLELIFRGLFNDLAENKKYPYLFNYLEESKRRAFFAGVMAGDGNKAGTTIKLTSKLVITQLVDLAISLKKIPTYREYSAYTDKNNIHHLASYSLYFRKLPSMDAFFETINGVLYLLQKVTIKEKQKDEPVYDITVDDATQSFLGEYYSLFNCGNKGDILDACHALENRPIEGSGFHDTIEYLCKMLKVPYEAAEETPESQFIKEVDHFLGVMVKKGNENLKDLIKNDPNNPIVQLLQTKGWIGSVEKYRLGTILQVEDPKSGKLLDICNFLNLNIKDLIGGIIIPIEFQHRLIGFQLRATALNNLNNVKYKTYLSTNKGLFNLDQVDTTTPVYVVEGASSVIVLNNFGITNTVATLGNGFNQAHYEALVSKGVKDIIVIYDNDDGGNIGRSRICDFVVGKKDLNVSFKLLEQDKDPADYVLAGKKIEDLKLVTLWEQLLTINKKEQLLKEAASQQDLIIKEQLVNTLVKHFNSTKAIIMEEVAKHESEDINVPTVMVLKEKEALIETINTFEKWAWSRGALLGVKSFDSLDKAVDGLQDGLILVSGAPNVGKSAFLSSLAIKIMENTVNPYILYVSIDDTALTTTSRLLANISGIPINIVSNPKHKIVDNPYYSAQEKKDLMAKREKGLEYLRKHVHMFNLKDAENGYTIEYIVTLLKSVAPLIKDHKVVLFLDNLHKLRSSRDFRTERALVDTICHDLKLISGIYKCPIISTVEQTKSSLQLGESGGASLKDSVALFYDANLIMNVSLKQEVGSFKLIDIIVSKNKMSAFRGSLPFKLYPELSKMEESSLAEDGLK